MVADSSIQLIALGIVVTGLLAATVGVAVAGKGYGIVGRLLVVCGALGIAAAIILGIVAEEGITERLEFLPGAIGLVVLGWGLVTTRAAGSRRKLALGVGAILVGTVTSGVMHGSGRLSLLGSVAAAIVAWDAGERAISLGEQVGRSADTTAVELVHASATASVGGAGIIAALLVADLEVTGLPLAGLVALVAAVIVLAAVLYG